MVTPIFLRLFLAFPQGSPVVHRFFTMTPRIFIAGSLQMRESSLTADVNIALPVIVQGWFCSNLTETSSGQPKGKP